LRTDDPRAASSLTEADGNSVQRQGVLIAGRRGNQDSRPGFGRRQFDSASTKCAQRRLGQHMLNLDSIADLGPSRSCRYEHRSEQFVPRV